MVDPKLAAKVLRLKKAAELAQKAVNAAQTALDTFTKARQIGDGVARATQLASNLTKAEAALTAANTALVTAEAEAAAAAASSVAARQVVKTGATEVGKQVVKRGVIATIANWLGISATAVIGWTVVAVVVVGTVTYVVVKSTSGSGETKTIPGRTLPTGGGLLKASGALDLNVFSGFTQITTVEINDVELSFPAEGGPIEGPPGAVLKFANFPQGTFVYGIDTYACVLYPFPGISPVSGVGTDQCRDVNPAGFPPEYLGCTATITWSFALTGDYDASAKRLSGTGTESFDFEYGSSCPDSTRKGLSDRPLPWSATVDGSTVRGTIETRPPMPFTATIG